MSSSDSARLLTATREDHKLRAFVNQPFQSDTPARWQSICSVRFFLTPSCLLLFRSIFLHHLESVEAVRSLGREGAGCRVMNQTMGVTAPLSPYSHMVMNRGQRKGGAGPKPRETSRCSADASQPTSLTEQPPQLQPRPSINTTNQR